MHEGADLAAEEAAAADIGPVETARGHPFRHLGGGGPAEAPALVDEALEEQAVLAADAVQALLERPAGIAQTEAAKSELLVPR